MNIQTTTPSKLPTASYQPTASAEGERTHEPQDSFLTDRQVTGLELGLAVGVGGAVVLGVPAAIGAAGGVIGIGAAALGSAALALMAPDDSEYPSSHAEGAFHSACFMGCLAGIGAAAGTAGVVACAGVGVAAGVLIAVAGLTS